MKPQLRRYLSVIAAATALSVAARADVLVSNLAEPFRDATPIANPEFWGAQSFVPDNQSYQLTSIEALMGNAADSPDVVAELRRSDLNGEIDQTAGGLLTTFTAPDLTGALSERKFTPIGAVTLDPSTKYWLIIGCTNAGGFDWGYAATNFSTGPGAIGDFADSDSPGPAWIYRGTDFPYYLQVNVAPPGSEWNLDGSGDWAVAGNWTGGVPDGVDAVANFLGAISSPRTVYTDAPVTLGTVRFDNANTYHLSGVGSLTLDVSTGVARIDVVQGNHKINLPLVLNDDTVADVATGAQLLIADPMTLVASSTLTKTGDGELVIEAPVRNAGPASVQVAGGTAVLNYPLGQSATGAAAAAAHLSVSVSGSKLVLGAPQVLSALDAETANAGDQEIDLAGQSVRVYAADLADAEQGLYDDIKSAKASASGLDGIYDSTEPASNYSVGVTDQAIDAHGDASVLVRLTRQGDANLDGSVDITDLAQLATNWQSPGLWDNGDFNYDGLIDISDLAMLATNWQTSADASSFATALASVGLGGVAVPEPGLAGLILVALAALSRRR